MAEAVANAATNWVRKRSLENIPPEYDTGTVSESVNPTRVRVVSMSVTSSSTAADRIPAAAWSPASAASQTVVADANRRRRGPVG